MSNEKDNFLNTLDEMEITMPKMSEEKIQRILKLELKKAGLDIPKKNIRSSSYKPKFKMVAGLVAAGLVFTLCFTALKESNISITADPNGIYGTTTIDPIDPNNNGSITSTDNNAGITSSTQVQVNNIGEALQELNYTVSLPKELTDNYNNTLTIEGKKLIINFENDKAALLLEAIPASELMSSSSVIISGFEILKISDYKVKIYGSNNNYTLVKWENNEVNYSLTSDDGLSKEDITNIIDSLKKIE